MLKVASRHGMAYMTVTLWPDDKDWICDCDSTDDACAHVAAAIIVMRRAQQDGDTMPRSSDATPGHMAYHLQCNEQRLSLQRVIVQGDTTSPLTHTLSALATGQVAGPAVAITQADLDVDHLLGRRGDGLIPRDMMPKLLSTLARCSDVFLNNDAVKTSVTPVYPRVLVSDQHHGFRIHIEPDPHITEVFTPQPLGL